MLPGIGLSGYRSAVLTLSFPSQTRSLLGVFEEDTAAISNYSNQLYNAMRRIYDAQNELSAATHLTSKLLKEYEKQRFPLGGDDEVMTSTLQQFSKVIDELSSCHAVLSTQLADAMMYPINQFKERDLKDHDIAINRYSRLSKRRENEKTKFEATEDVYTSRKKMHQTMMHYFCALNTIQYKKKSAILEPLLGYMQSQINFFKMGSENLNTQLEEFMSNISTSVQNVRREMDTDVDNMQQTIQDMEAASEVLYVPDPDPKQLPTNRNLTRKAGYLNIRNKTGLVSSSWERQYFFTQGGNLMSQARGDVAGGLVMDIDNCSVMAVDSEDRRYCFQITWIASINNISKRIYLTENPEETAARVNQTALEAVTPSPSFQQRHESMRPAPSSRPNTTRTNSTSSVGSESSVLTALSLDSIVAPDTPIQFDIISPVSEDQSGQQKTQSGRRTNPFGESGEKSLSSEDSILHQLFIVRFLGSMEVKTDESTEVVYEIMRQILAALIPYLFPLSNVVLYATHQENKRLFGFVLRTAGGRAEGRPVSVCYIFESNNEGEKICDSVGLAKQIALHAELDRRASEKQKEIEKVKEKQQKEISKQKAIEKDLEVQSRLIAASSRPNQAGAEGQFVVLSSSQSDDSDLGENGKKKKESEA
uniref:Adaptor protein, phosphotyrosine interacting with PH domain and leucine zipper 1 n=1 Tax=Leptobrachium leishanense TaxID=445787 RepID=A0A8C5RB97_9ANUR